MINNYSAQYEIIKSIDNSVSKYTNRETDELTPEIENEKNKIE